VCWQIAVTKLSEAERAKDEMEQELKRKAQELEKRTGARFRLAGGADIARMSVSHRGPGAFPRAEMTWRRRADDETTNQSQLLTDQQEQVPAEPDTAAASDSSDVGCSVCPPSQTDDSRPPAPDEAGTVQSSADNGELSVDEEQQSRDERKTNCYDDDARQSQSTPPLGAGNAEQQLITASTS